MQAERHPMNSSLHVQSRGGLCAGFLAAAVVSGLAAPSHAGGDCAVGWFEASYYDASKNWAVQCERTIDHRWGQKGPVVVASNAGKTDRMTEFDVDNFGVIWEGRFLFAAGTYTFFADTDDGMKVFIDDHSILDEWRNQGTRHYEVKYAMSAGQHRIKVVYYEDTNAAEARFWWKRQ
jgi:hypothetical protein